MGTVVDTVRQALGPVGAFLSFSTTATLSGDTQRAVAHRLERAGYRAAWTNETVGGKDALVQSAVLLAATERMVLGTGIANVWARAPQTAHGGAALLAQAYPDRFVLGLGVGYPSQAAAVGREFGRPLAMMRDYLTTMATPSDIPAPDVAYPRLVAANGPKLVALGGELADGAMPAMLPPEFTARARELLGPDKLLVVALGVVLDADRDRARAAARETVSRRLSRPDSPYGRGLARLGYSDQEIAEAGDRVVDATVAHGDEAAVAAKVREHLAAGADHVLLAQLGGDFLADVANLERLAPALELSE